MYLFDTDILSQVAKRKRPPALMARLARTPLASQFTSISLLRSALLRLDRYPEVFAGIVVAPIPRIPRPGKLIDPDLGFRIRRH